MGFEKVSQKKTLYFRGARRRAGDAMFALMARAAHPQATEQLFLKNGMSEAAIRDHEIQKNSDMIDFCTTTYSSIRNREYCIDVSPSPAPFLPHPAHAMFGRVCECVAREAASCWWAGQTVASCAPTAHYLPTFRGMSCVLLTLRCLRQKFVKPQFNYLNM